MTRHYSTTAGPRQLAPLKVLLASMRRHCQPFRLHVLAEGEEVAGWAREQDDVGVMRVETLLTVRPELRPENLPGPPRNANELACCWRWWFMLELLESYRGPVLAVDADLMFWSSPEPLFEEIGRADCAVLPHAFPRASRGLPGVTQESHGRYGRFNGGLVYFADFAPAAAMAELCRQWSQAATRTRASGRETWGDQGNLELVHEKFGAHVIEHPGAAPGPWNIHTQRLTRGERGEMLFGGLPLVAFHYSSLRPGQLADASYEVTARQAELLYAPYLAALAAAAEP